ncbi:MAG: DoxX family protein [Saprospiraceae bacterium]
MHTITEKMTDSTTTPSTKLSFTNRLIQSGKYLFLLPFAIFGFLHFGPLEFSIDYVPDFLPFKAFWVYFVGVALFAFVISALVKKLDKLAAVSLAIMLLLFVFLIHIPKATMGDFIGIIATARDVAMAGAALMYAQKFAKDDRFVN